MTDTLMQRLRDHLTEGEGFRANPYKDTKGKLTVGTGFLVDDEKSFLKMPLWIKDPMTGLPRAATDDEKKKEFKRTKDLPAEKLNKGTERSAFTLQDSDNLRLLDERITSRIGKVKTEIGEPDWNSLTDGQKVALIDIHYANGSLKGFPKLKEAVKAGDAKAMAENADFHGGRIGETKHHHRNFDRIRNNRAMILGIDPESDAAYRAVADTYRDHPSLRDEYKKHLSPLEDAPQAVPSGAQSRPSIAADGSVAVQFGDTLSRIAARHNMSMTDLAKANGIDNPNRLHVGQNLIIPGKVAQGRQDMETGKAGAATPDKGRPQQGDFPLWSPGRPGSTLLTMDLDDEEGPKAEARRLERQLYKLYPTMRPKGA